LTPRTPATVAAVATDAPMIPMLERRLIAASVSISLSSSVFFT